MFAALKTKTVVWFAALIVIVNGVFPALWILFTSLKTEGELLQLPITLLTTPTSAGA